MSSVLTERNLRADEIRIALPALNALQVCAVVLLFAAAFFNMADLIGNKAENAIDYQTLIKLGICSFCGLFGVYGAFTWAPVQKSLTSLPGVLLLAIGIIFLISVPFSVDPVSTLVAAGLFWTILLMTTSAMHCLGRERALLAIGLGLLAFTACSWLAFLFYPELGVFYESTTEGRFQARMNGISHPNTLGIFSGLLAALLIAAGMQGKFQWRWLAIPILITLGALVLSLSRSSILAFALSTLVVNRGLLRRKDIFGLCLFAISALILALFVISLSVDLTRYIDDALQSLSKSGEVEELTSGTGRLDIWAFGWDQFRESPLFGKGLATSKVVMAEYSGYTHNLWLNFFYSGGIFCGISGIALTVILLLRIFRRPAPLIDGAILFILIAGCAENVILNPFPSGPTMLLIVATLWFSFQKPDTQQQSALLDSHFRDGLDAWTNRDRLVEHNPVVERRRSRDQNGRGTH
jgi:O-antigen ligase